MPTMIPAAELHILIAKWRSEAQCLAQNPIEHSDRACLLRSVAHELENLILTHKVTTHAEAIANLE